MKRRRRLVLQSLAAAVTSLPCLARSMPIRIEESGGAPAANTLRAFLDTLIPADTTPAASAFGIDRVISDTARRNESYWRLIEQGAVWLDDSARALGAKSFTDANEAQRIQVVT